MSGIFNKIKTFIIGKSCLIVGILFVISIIIFLGFNILNVVLYFRREMSFNDLITYGFISYAIYNVIGLLVIFSGFYFDSKR